MQKTITRILSVLLSAVMLLQMSDGLLAYAAEDPTEGIDLSVPEALQDGSNYFFIREDNFSISEKSPEKLYIPIQRAGDTEGETEVTIKVIDVSARYGTNYKASLYGDRTAPEAVYDGLNVRDLFENADEQEETEIPTESELGQVLYENGGADWLTPDGRAVGTITAVPLDEDGNPIPAETASQNDPSPAETVPSAASALADLRVAVSDTAQVVEENAPSPAQRLMAARNAISGNVSDRQELAGGDVLPLGDPGQRLEEQAQGELTEEDLLEDSYPGREFRVHFDPGQTARFLVIDPKYSPAADGDCAILLMLKGLPEGASVPEDWNMRSVLITDEDAQETVTISMADAQVRAEDGVAAVTVTREGQLNNLVGVMLSSQDGSATAGDDYSGVGAKLWFPMGVKERTVELPVGHGAADKDFTLTISPLPDGADVTIGRANTHVIIPAAKTAEADAQLMEDDPYGDLWNLRDRKLSLSSGGRFESDTAVYLETDDDECQTQFISLNADCDYAWDGIHLEYDYHTWYSKGIVKIDKLINGKWESLFSKDWGDCAWERDHSADAYFGAEKAPLYISIDNRTYEVHNIFRDSHSDLWIKEVMPIKRNFNIKLADPTALTFEGMTAEQVQKEYQPTILNDSLDSVWKGKTLDNFSVSREGAKEWARLKALYAVSPDGKNTFLLAESDGKTGTISCQLSEDIINLLAEKGMIAWKAGSSGSYSGTIIVRPLYDYVSNITVKVRETPYGTLQYNGKDLNAGTYTFHYGDRLTFTPNVTPTWEGEVRAVGVGHESRSGSAAGPLTGKSDCDYFVGSGVTFTLTEDYYEFWQVFTNADNTVRVRVSAADAEYFDTSEGLFTGLTPTATSDGYLVYQVKSGVLTNEFVDLQAFPADESYVPVWTLPGTSSQYSGTGFCFYAGVSAADNLVTLGIDRNAGSHAWYALSGTVCTSTMNLATGHEADDSFPVRGAVITAAQSGAQSDEDGTFTMVPMYLLGGSMARYTVTFNGETSIREVKLAPATAPTSAVSYMDPETGSSAETEAIPVSLGAVKVAGWIQTGAHVANVVAKLTNFESDIISALEMNGKTLTVTITVDPGQKYLFNGKEYEEQITDVTLYFQSQITGDVHGIYSTTLKEGENEPGLKWDPDTNTATLTIRQFKPDSPDKYTWGDVLMVQISTDKQVPGRDTPGMSYQPVSSGYAVISDKDYVPETFDYQLDMQSMMLMLGGGDDGNSSEDDGNTRYSFGKFPWLGEISGVIRTFSYFSSAGGDLAAQEILDDLELMEDGDAQLMAAGAPRRWALSAAVAFKETPYGGVRTMFAVAGSWGNSVYSKRANPYRSWTDIKDYFNAVVGGDANGKLLYEGGTDSSQSDKNKFVKSELGGKYLYFTVYVGFYFDWGYIEVAKNDGSGKTEISHEAVYLGAGGFVGGKLTAGYTKYVFPYGVPVYFNFEAFVDATLFIGSSADPNKTLESFYNTTDHKGQDFDLEVEILAELTASLSIGVGFFKVLSARITGGIGVQVGWSMKMEDWYPGLEGSDTVSYCTDAMFAGTIDVIVTSIDLYSASFPLPFGYGWLQYFQQSRRANALIHFINEGINDGEGDAEARAECRRRADELAAYVDAYNGSGPELRRMVNSLQDYAWDEDVISFWQWNRVNMTRQGGIVGNIMDTVMLTEDSEAETNTLFHTRDHVDSQWVAGQDAQLQAAFGPVHSETIMENAVSQPVSQIMAIGQNQFLLVFLDDDESRDRQQANVLMWTVYNASTDEWTAPQKVQDDGTADGHPNLVDAGEKVILSWPSIEQGKYEDLKAAVAKELEAKNGAAPTDAQIQKALENDPARVMAQTDIFSVEFTKSTQTFGDIEQLTDDDYYDDSPQAVFDSKSGDYIVLYYKTGQSTDEYDDASDQLLDLVSANADPQKTYCVLCYMLYNATEDPDAGYCDNTYTLTTVPAGWVRGHLYEKEFSKDSMEAYGGLQSYLDFMKGQRVLSSPITSTDASGDVTQTDAPIADLTACIGYNGLAAYAFTVDKDFDLNTTEDKDLYVQFYRFADHATYVPVKVAGDAVKSTLNPPVRAEQADGSWKTTTPASVTEAATPVTVGQPKIIRNGGSTWLFWREDNEYLRYLNLSEMMNAKVSKVSDPKDESDLTYAVDESGRFVKDARTGETYVPNVQTVDFGSIMTENDMDITDYQVITDKDDNLYVIWTDVFTYENSNTELGGTVTSPAQAIYATAKIKEADNSKDGDGAATGDRAFWSKPYRLTRDNNSNDGVTVALDDNGGLILVHNQYELLLADTEQEIAYMMDQHLAGTWKDEETGHTYFLGYPYYPSDIRLMVTRCDAIGSVEATAFAFSDDTPVAGQTVDVTAVIENTGLTSAAGCDIKFYAYKNGVQGPLLSTVTSSDTFLVNTAKKATFQWTVPADGPEGWCIQAVATEKKAGGGSYDAVESFSDVFAVKPEYELALVKCVQNGDVFDVEYTVANTGNLAVPAGTKANLYLEGLYGDLKEKYGMDTDLLIEEDISGLAPGETRTVEQSITLPVTVFKFCGYDAVTVAVVDQDDTTLAATDHNFITLDAPLNPVLNDGKDMTVKAGRSKSAGLTFDSTVFMDANGAVIYSVDDPSIASVDENGNVTGLSNGTTTLTATFLPSGRTTSVKVQVNAGGSSGGGTASSNITIDKTSGTAAYGTVTASTTNARAGQVVTLTVTPNDGYTVSSITVTDRNGNTVPVTDNGDGTYSFVMPDTPVTVTPAFSIVEPSTDVSNCKKDASCPISRFADASPTAWYHDGVHWALDEGVMNGVADDRFAPNDPTSRAMIVTMLYRMEGEPEGSTSSSFRDVPSGQWYTDAVNWANANKIVEGYSDVAFGPMDNVTREQLVTILDRYAKFRGMDVSKGEEAYLTGYSDADTISSWAVKSFRWAVDAGIIQGVTDDTLSPGTDASRAQVATMLMRFDRLP